MPGGHMGPGSSSDSAFNDDKEEMISSSPISSQRSVHDHDVQPVREAKAADGHQISSGESKSQESGYEDTQLAGADDTTWPSPQSVTDEGQSQMSGGMEENSQGEVSLTARSGGSGQSALKKGETFDWTPYAELHLLNALRGLRPVGANYHFYIQVVHERFNSAMDIDLPRSELVKKINTYYNFDEALKIGGEDLRLNRYQFFLNKEDFGQEMKNLQAKRVV